MTLGGLVPWGGRADEEPLPDYVVELKDFFFDPPGLVLRRGNRVSWVLVGDVLGDGHTATAYHPAFDKVLRIPESAPPWNSGFLFKLGASWTHQFTAPGVHDYFCVPHEDVGMVGRLLVEEASGPGTQSPEVGLSPAGRATIPAVEELLGVGGEVFNLEGKLNVATFALERNDRAAALGVWQRLNADLAAALPQLWPTLEPAEREEVRVALSELGALLSDESLQEVRRAVEELKVLLERLAFRGGMQRP